MHSKDVPPLTFSDLDQGLASVAFCCMWRDTRHYDVTKLF